MKEVTASTSLLQSDISSLSFYFVLLSHLNSFSSSMYLFDAVWWYSKRSGKMKHNIEHIIYYDDEVQKKVCSYNRVMSRVMKCWIVEWLIALSIITKATADILYKLTAFFWRRAIYTWGALREDWETGFLSIEMEDSVYSSGRTYRLHPPFISSWKLDETKNPSKNLIVLLTAAVN